MQSLSEIYSPHTTILNISEGAGEGIEEDISSLSETKKQLLFEKEKNRILKHGPCSNL